jgi:hypothetical protein
VVSLDEKNSTIKWHDAVKLEMSELAEDITFTDRGHSSVKQTHKGTKLVLAVKHDGRHEGCLVTDGHLTEFHLHSVYYGVVSLCSIHLIVFLVELNGLDTWATDIGNAYLEVETQEKQEVARNYCYPC